MFPFYRKGKIGFIDRTGKVVVEPQFDPGFLYFAGFTEFSEGMARISVEREDGGLPGARSRIGFIDTTGKVAIEPQYDLADDFSEELAAVQTKGGWGYIDTTGQLVIKPQFDGAGEFVEGLAQVTFEKYHGDVPHFGRRIGYIDRTGKYVWRPSR